MNALVLVIVVEDMKEYIYCIHRIMYDGALVIMKAAFGWSVLAVREWSIGIFGNILLVWMTRTMFWDQPNMRV